MVATLADQGYVRGALEPLERPTKVAVLRRR
jgi:hypothetical protein